MIARWSRVAAMSAALAGCADVGPPTWSADAAPIVYENCAPCHRPGGPAPFTLLSYDDAVERAQRIRRAVSQGRMPPWLPSAHTVAFEADRRLAPDEVETLIAWIDQGTARGDAGAEPPAPTWASGWALGEPGLVLTMDAAYPLPGDGPDHFRNFVLPIPVDGPRFVRAVELRPGKPEVVHHATMQVDPTASSRIADAADPLPGYDQMFSRAMAQPPGGFFLGWTPGRTATPFPEGMAWRVEPGTDFVVQLHLRPTGEPADVDFEVGFYFADEPPTRMPVIVRLGGQSMDIPPGEARYLVEDSIRLPVAVQAMGAFPHAHYLGRSMRVVAEPPGGPEVVLMDIPRWDFNWQDEYRYASPVALPAGTMLRLTYSFDNSADNELNPFDPPRRVVYGPASSDEMAEFWLQVVTADETDLRELAGALTDKDRRDKAEGYRFMLGLDPGDAESHLGLGTLAQAQGELLEAAEHYQTALDLRPDLPRAWYNLALIQEEWGDNASALRSYEQAVAALPQYPQALSNLGRLQARRGEREEALAILQRAVETDSSNAESWNNLGGILLDLGRAQEAESVLARALALRPDFAPAVFNRSRALAATGRVEEALAELNRGLELDPGNIEPIMALAWQMATTPDEAHRYPEIAGGLAEQVLERTGPHPVVSDVAAAAYAAAGRFDRAVRLIDDAIAEARRRGDDARLPELQERAALYRSGRPFIQRQLRPARSP